MKYMKLLETAPPLKAESLADGYRVLAEFNGTVLAGKKTLLGAQFVTWAWDYDRRGVSNGHYRGCPYHLQCRPGYHRDSLSSPVAGAKPESGGHPADVKKLLDITGTLWYVVCLPEERAGKSYEPSEKTEHAQEPR